MRPPWRPAVLALAVATAFGLAGQPTPVSLTPGTNPGRPTAQTTGDIRVIVELAGSDHVDALVRSLGGRPGRHLAALRYQSADIPAEQLARLAGSPEVASLREDRPVVATLERTAAAVGATWVRQSLGYDGTGVGVAIVDSGITPWHDDLAGAVGREVEMVGGSPAVMGGQRVAHFVDFVGGLPSAYDDFGHGTHVAGTIAGNGYDSGGSRAGMAPGATIVALKALDGAGQGRVSDVIAAIDYAIEHRDRFNIRVLNLSVAAAVDESFRTDPLTVAARRAVEAGIVVVTAAGNLGLASSGQVQFGGVTAPGNAPWVITVGAASHQGTDDHADDVRATFSSIGPGYLDHVAKPDLLAPGVGTASLSDPGSALYAAHPAWRLGGSIATWYAPYLTLSGTSMASPVVSGTVALMLQANPRLTPNAVKAILEYTARPLAGVHHLAQGAGLLNARGAVRLAERFGGGTARPDDEADESTWGRHLLWGNHRVGGGLIRPDTSAWGREVTWGALTTPQGQGVVWGLRCGNSCAERIDSGGAEVEPWGTTRRGETVVWDIDPEPENVVWGTECGGADCENVVWGTACEVDACEGRLWGTAEAGDRVLWAEGRARGVWGPGDSDDLVRSSLRHRDNVLWNRRPDVRGER